MTIKDRALQVAAVLVAIFGLVITAGALIDIFDKQGTSSTGADIALLILIGVLPLAFGVWLFRHTQAGIARRALEARERTLLTLASQHMGVLTVPQVADESDMTLEQAKQLLDRLNLKGFNEMAVTESGTIEYKFRI